MNETILDLRGRTVVVGDRIAYSANDGDTAGLRTGTVLEIIPAHEKVEKYWTRKVPTKLRVEVEHSTGYSKPSKPVLIEAKLKRFVRL